MIECGLARELGPLHSVDRRQVLVPTMKSEAAFQDLLGAATAQGIKRGSPSNVKDDVAHK
jgi:hypothetical protein